MAKEKKQHRPGQTRNWISITIAVVAMVIILYWVGALKIAELKSLDLMFRLRGHLEPNPDIVVVAIDDLTGNGVALVPQPACPGNYPTPNRGGEVCWNSVSSPGTFQ